MKKFYVLVTFLVGFLGFVNSGYSQFVATTSGSWSNNGIWAPGTKPPQVCSGCTITINTGVSVILDQSVTLTGGSTLTIGTSTPGAAALIIPNSGSGTIAGGFNILLEDQGTANKIVVFNSTSGVVASTAGEFDGIFGSSLGGTILTKLVGNPNTHSLFFNGQVATGTPNPPPAHQSVPGPATLSGNNALPIILGSFNAVLGEGGVNLSWTTLIEVNGDHFDVERSIDAVKWSTLGTVSAVGNSSKKVSYSYSDASPSSGANYYRLKMVDKDGKYKYSPVKVVRGTAIKGFSVFPNPAKDYVNVTVSSDAAAELTLRLINQSGQVLQEKKFAHAAGTTVSLSVGNYPAGNYMLSISGNDGSRTVSKVLIAR